VTAGVKAPDRGLGGKLDVLMLKPGDARPPLGGCGKAFMLMVFRNVLPAPFTPGAVRSLGNAVPPPGVVGKLGKLDDEGARRPLFPEVACRLETVGTIPVLFLVFGNAGSAVVGGPYDGRPVVVGRGIDAAIVDFRMVCEKLPWVDQKTHQVFFSLLDVCSLPPYAMKPRTSRMCLEEPSQLRS